MKTNFVIAGREEQLQQLNLALTDCLEGKPRTVLVEGGAGIGKTRMVFEFYREAKETKSLKVIHCKCGKASRDNSTYLPFKDIYDELKKDTQFNKTIVKVGKDIIGNLPWVGWAIKAGLDFYGANEETPAQSVTKDMSYENLRQVFINYVDSELPLVIVLDDLQYADEGTLELFFFLARRFESGQSAQLLLIGTYCLEDAYKKHAGEFVPLKQYLDDIKSNRYSRVPKSIVEINMLATVLGENGMDYVKSYLAIRPNKFTELFSRQLFERTKGQPSAVEFYWGVLQAQGYLREAEGVWIDKQPIPWDELPDDRNALLRLDSLELDLKNILICGSVEGKRFTGEVVARTWKLDEFHMASRLNDELHNQHHFIEPDENIELTHRQLHTYSFKKESYQQYLYGELSGWQREHLHRCLAENLEELYGEQVDRVALQLANHFISAGLKDKAIAYYLLAGDQASESLVAAKYYEEARSLLNESQQEHAYLIARSLAVIYSSQEQLHMGRTEIERMKQLAQRLGCKARLIESYTLEARRSIQAKKYQRAIDQGALAIEEYRDAIAEGNVAHNLADEIGEELETGEMQVILGEANRFLGELDKALEHLQCAESFYRRRTIQEGLAETLRQKTLVFLSKDEYFAAHATAQEALVLFRRENNREGEHMILRYIGDVHEVFGNYEEALQCYQEVLRIRREIGNRELEGGALGDIGDVYLALGFYEKSLDYHQRSLWINEEVNRKIGQTWCHLDIGVIKCNQKKFEEARRSLKQAIELAEEVSVEDVSQKHLLVRSKNALARAFCEENKAEDFESAVEQAENAIEISEQAGLNFGLIVGLSHQARAYMALGEKAKARECSGKAVTLLELVRVTGLPEEEVFFNHYRILRDTAEHDVALTYLKRAYDRLQEKAGKIKNVKYRKSFLSNDPLNKEIVDAGLRHLLDQNNSITRNQG